MLPSITIFGKEIYLYGICVLSGIIALAIKVHIRRIKNALLFKDTVWFYYFSFLGMILGAKFLGFLSMIPTVIHYPSLKNIFIHIDASPIVFYGGLLGALSGGSLYAKISMLNTHLYFNSFIPAYPLFHAFGRIGCFFGGCCYGIECTWGFPMAATPDIKRVPVQLIEAAFELMVFATLLIIDRRRHNDCSLTAVYLALYAPFRFIIEFFRGDEIRGFFGPFSTSQWISLIIIFTLSVRTLFRLVHKSVRNKSKYNLD